MKKIITKTEFLQLLSNKHFYSLSYVAKELIYSVFVRLELSKQEAYDIVNGANKKEILSSEDRKFVHVNLLKLVTTLNKQTDVELYKRINEIDKIFKSYFRANGIKQADYTEGLRDCWALAKRINNNTSKNTTEFTKEELNTFEILAKLYRSIVEHVDNRPIKALVREKDKETGKAIVDPETNKYKMISKEFVRVADYIVSTRLGELENSTLSLIKKSTVEQFDGFLRAITSTAEDNAKDTFSKDEVEELLDKAISIITRASAEKYVYTRNALNTYLDTILNQEIELEGTENYEKFSEISAKSIILKCASVLNMTTETIGFSLDFVMGKDMLEISENNAEMSKTSVAGQGVANLKKYYPNLKLIGMNLDSHLYFAKQNTSMLQGLNPNSVFKTTTAFVNIVANGLGYEGDLTKLDNKIKWLREQGFDIESCYTNDNVFQVFTNQVFKIVKDENNEKQADIAENIRFLSTYLFPQDIQKIFCHNFNLLLIDPDLLKSKISEMQQECGATNNKFKDMFHEFINAKYNLNEKTEKISKKRSRLEKTNIEIETIDEPDKEYIEVNILGLDDVEEVEVEDQTTDLSFTDLYNMVCYELSELEMYAKMPVDNLKESYVQFDSKYVARVMAKVHLNYSVGLKHDFNKVLDNLTDKIELLETYDEFGDDERDYLVMQIKGVVKAFTERQETTNLDLAITDEEISIKTKDEMNKKSRKSPKPFDDAMERIDNLKGNNLLARAYEKLKPEYAELQEAKAEVMEENNKVHIYRTEKRRPLLQKSLSLRTEMEFVEKLIKDLDETEMALITEKTKTEIFDDAELRDRLEELHNQRALKVNKIKVKYAGRIRSNNFTEQDLELIVSDNAFGKRILSAIKAIDKEIAEIEEQLNAIQSI